MEHSGKCRLHPRLARPLPCNKNLTKKPLDIKHKLCYNEYMKGTRKSPKNQKGKKYEEEHYDHYR